MLFSLLYFTSMNIIIHSYIESLNHVDWEKQYLLYNNTNSNFQAGFLDTILLIPASKERDFSIQSNSQTDTLKYTGSIISQ